MIDRVSEGQSTETDRGAPRTTVNVRADRGGRGIGGAVVAVAALIAIAIAAYFVLNMNRQEALRTDAVADAASNVADSADRAAEKVSNAVDRATR